MPSKPIRPSRKIEPTAAAVFGANARRVRLEQGLSQAEIAQRAGLLQNKMPPIEQGQVDLRLSTARKIARALGTPLRDLLPD